MRRFLGWTMVGLVLLATAGSAAAQQMDMISYTEYESLMRRIEQLEAQVANGGGGDCCPVSAPVCRTPGIVAGGEITWLKVFDSEGQGSNFAYQAAPRFWLGYQFEGGLGFRARYFEYDKQASTPGSNMYDGFHMVNFDLELTDTFELGKWSGLISGGVRFTEYREEYDAAGTDFEEMAGDNIGLVLGIEGYRPVTSNVYLFGLTRGSISVFDKRVSETGTILGNDYSFFIWELQLGAEYRYPICGTSYLFARAAAEAQVWSGIGDDDSEDITLFGGLFSVGLAR